MAVRRFRAGLVALLGIWLSVSASAGPVQIGPDELRKAAVFAIDAGQPARAEAYATALIARDETDFSAHLIHSRALRDLGEHGSSKEAARRAWKLAETPDERYAASLVMAQALSSAGQRTFAQLWLRRAIHEAPHEAASQKAIRDFRYVRANNPWLTRFSFSITPDSNINNGSSERSSFLNYEVSELLFGEPVEYELGGRARALSGLEYAFGFRTRYRFHQTETSANDITAAFDLRLYSLSSEARDIAPDASGSDFTFVSYRLGYAHRGLNFDRNGEYRVATDIGQSWYGGEQYARFIRLSATQAYWAHADWRLSGRLSGERQFGINTNDSDTIRGDVTVSRRINEGTWFSLTFTGAETHSPTRTEEFTELGLRAQMVLDEPMFGTDVIFGLGLRDRDYDFSPHSRAGRSDRRTSADVTFVFTDVDYYGFNPTMTVSASSNESNIRLYDSDRFGVNFGIQSAF